ncbi:hypothetical protein LOK49_LG06G02753 [Camellia lanceoleosa]|uniref:Uncharacterized protein n=1 Tax=Camellia lanceoleosa TaxID=1840588 RepID=A0ACC0HDS1_9ERIC|nr:hypothetical protein LOK49_LG06G02753 [Camellia lanceoleosa]
MREKRRRQRRVITIGGRVLKRIITGLPGSSHLFSSVVYLKSKEWAYFLNKGSKVNISYSVKSPSSAPLSLVIAQGSTELHIHNKGFSL